MLETECLYPSSHLPATISMWYLEGYEVMKMGSVSFRELTELLPCEDTLKKQLSMNQKAGPHQTSMLLTLTWISKPPDLWELNFVIAAQKE